MELNIGQYKLFQRTPYSKFQLFDAGTNTNITAGNEEVIEKILDEYKEQEGNLDTYFRLDSSEKSIVELKRAAHIFNNIFLPDKINYIGNEAFCGAGFYRIHIPETIKSIGEKSFMSCESLEGIYLPDTIEKISEFAFCNCSELTDVKLPSYLKVIDKQTFTSCIALENISIPDTVIALKDCAFSKCINLTNIKLPKKLNTLREKVFRDCLSLENIDLPESLAFIDKKCFAGCISLKKISIPDSVMFLGDEAFLDCKALENVKLSRNLISLYSGIFANCKSLKEIVLPDSIEKLEGRIFSGTECLENINIPKNLKVIYNSKDTPFELSSIKSLTFNYDLPVLECSPLSSFDLITNSKINKLIIDSTVRVITQNAFIFSGAQIKEIEYLGTKEQFEEFKNNNQELFDVLTGIEKINFLEEIEKGSIKEVEERM